MNLSRYTSIIFCHYSMNEERVGFMKRSIESLLKTTEKLPVEIIVVDNGGDIDCSDYFMELVKAGELVSYIRNAHNMHFGFARNQGVAMSNGNYIGIIDNDILYKDNWLEACLDILEAYPDENIYATPIHYPTSGMREKYHIGDLELDDKIYQKSMRAGSNCFIIRRKDYEEIGKFLNHRIAGSKWTDEAVRKKYLAAITPDNMIKDMGLRRGYDLHNVVRIRRILKDGQEVVFNDDELIIEKNI